MGIDLSPRAFMASRKRGSNAAGTRAEVEHVELGIARETAQSEFDDAFRFRAWREHVLVDRDGERPEFAHADKLRNRTAMRALVDEFAKARVLFVSDDLVAFQNEIDALDSQHVCQKHFSIETSRVYSSRLKLL